MSIFTVLSFVIGFIVLIFFIPRIVFYFSTKADNFEFNEITSYGSNCKHTIDCVCTIEELRRLSSFMHNLGRRHIYACEFGHNIFWEKINYHKVTKAYFFEDIHGEISAYAIFESFQASKYEYWNSYTQLDKNNIVVIKDIGCLASEESIVHIRILIDTLSIDIFSGYTYLVILDNYQPEIHSLLDYCGFTIMEDAPPIFEFIGKDVFLRINGKQLLKTTEKV